MNALNQTRTSRSPFLITDPGQCSVVLLDSNLDIYYCNNMLTQRGDIRQSDLVGRSFSDAFPTARASTHLMSTVEGVRNGEIDQQTVWFDHPVPFPRRDETWSTDRRPQTEQGVMLFRFDDAARRGHVGMVIVDRAAPSIPSVCLNTTCTVRQFPAGSDADLRAELERTQMRLLQAEKMAAVGQLAAGVAHEINNPIGYVFSNLRGLSGYLKDILRLADAVDTVDSVEQLRQIKRGIDYDFLRQDIESLIAESEEGLDRVNRIVAALKDFSHCEEKESFRPADLHRILETTLSVVNNEIKYKADVVREFGDIPPIDCVSSQINQVAANLLVNAAQAMPEFGRITVRTGADATMAWFEIEDNGAGIDPQQIERIFEPFFTTKPAGTGTGLGLSISYNIVQKHDGRIEVFSSPGQGTRFRVSLPITHPAPNCATGNCQAKDCGQGTNCNC